MKTLTKYTLVSSLLMSAMVFSGSVMAQAPAPAKADTATKAPKAAPVVVSDKDIADAKAKGMVWVNTNTKVYHTDGDFYGKTKQGKFMTKDDADKAGFKMAKEPASKKKAAPADKK